MEETVDAFEEARLAGRIRHVGLSNYTPERIRQWFAIADAHGCARPIVLQPHYNLLHRGDVEGPGARGQVAAELGMGLMPYFALAAGFLTGKYRRDEPISGERAGMVADYQRPECYDVVETVARGGGGSRGGTGSRGSGLAARPSRCHRSVGLST